MPVKSPGFVDWFRLASPYIHAHRGQTMVIAFGGEAMLEPGFQHLIHDIALLNSLGMRLVIVYGVRPQVEARLRRAGQDSCYQEGLRVTDDVALEAVKEAAGSARLELEALLSMGLANTPMDSARIRVAGGNYITARPLGVLDGVDYCHTGSVRRVDAKAITGRLDAGEIVLLPALGYSPTAEVFNLGATDVATAVARALRAAKLVLMIEDEGIHNHPGELLRQMTWQEAELALESDTLSDSGSLSAAVAACRDGVGRTHIISHHHDGALLLELFSRDGIGTLISATPFDHLRRADIEDVGGILNLISPLEEQGVLVRRSREKLELEIDHFTVLERDGAVIACAALYPYPEDEVGELACLVVDPEYRGQGFGDALLQEIQRQAATADLRALLVLSTQTAHWFVERGFSELAVAQLPMQRQQLYNWQRNSKVFSLPI